MLCSYCQKIIKNNSVKIGRGSLVLNRATEKRNFSPSFYHQGCYQLILEERKKQQKRFWVLLAVILTAFILILIVMAISGSFK